MKPWRQNTQPTHLFSSPVASQAQTLVLHGLEMFQKGLLPQAAALYKEALKIQPGHFDALHLLGLVAYKTNDFEGAVKLINQAIAINPANALAHYNLGLALMNLNKHKEAGESCSRAIQLQPDFADAYFVRGNALKDLHQIQAAVEDYERAIQLQPSHANAHNNRGAALKILRQNKAAWESCIEAIRLKPDMAGAYNNLGNILKEMGLYQDAIDHFNHAIQLEPDLADAHLNCGFASMELKQYQNAIERFDMALQLNPEAHYVREGRLHLKLRICDWRDFESESRVIESTIETGKKESISFYALGFFDLPRLHRKAAGISNNGESLGNALPNTLSRRQEGEKIRIGYYSADFKDHPVSQVMAEVFECHDRSKFEILGFSLRPANDSMRQRITAAFDKFIDVQEMSDLDIARLSRQFGIDIAIDLNGHTSGCRPNIFSLRAAPLQVNFLGYPGTSGASYMDYMVADNIVIPPESREFYSEQIIYLPSSFFPSDSKRLISTKKFSRSDFNLPPSGFVFCCFNESYKITPQTFDVWMRLLQKVEGSVLWLSSNNETATSNLRNEATQRGVNPERLVFAQRIPSKDEHLARLALADLFLDTFPYNAHTSANDALWAGLPVLTRMGQSFASRVAASQLMALNLAELVTSTVEEYELLAVELAHNQDRLAQIKSKISSHRSTSPLFNTERFTRQLEKAYTSIFERHQAGLPPAHINIEPLITGENKTIPASH